MVHVSGEKATNWNRLSVCVCVCIWNENRFHSLSLSLGISLLSRAVCIFLHFSTSNSFESNGNSIGNRPRPHDKFQRFRPNHGKFHHFHCSSGNLFSVEQFYGCIVTAMAECSLALNIFRVQCVSVDARALSLSGGLEYSLSNCFSSILSSVCFVCVWLAFIVNTLYIYKINIYRCIDVFNNNPKKETKINYLSLFYLGANWNISQQNNEENSTQINQLSIWCSNHQQQQQLKIVSSYFSCALHLFGLRF